MAKRTGKRRNATTKKGKVRLDPQTVLSQLEWRSKEPLGFADRDLGQARLEARGVYSIRIVDPGAFKNEFSEPERNPEGIRAHLQGKIVARFDDLLKRRLHSIRDLPGLTNDLAAEVRLEIKEDLSRWGIHLIDFFVTSLVPTREFQKIIDEHLGIENGDESETPSPNPDRDPPGHIGIRPGATSSRGSGGNGFVLPEALVGKNPCPRCGFAFLEVCGTCGSSLPERARFCPGCGAAQS